MGQIDTDLFVCLDLETTGLEPGNDRIIELAAVRFSFEKIVEQMESLIDPERPIPESSIEIHHITDSMVAGKPKIAEMLPALLKFVGKSMIIGHGISMDIAFLVQAAKQHNIPSTLHTNPTIDTLRMARLYGESPSNSLEMLRVHFNIPSEGAHRAMSDVLVNIDVFKFLAAKFSRTEQLIDRLQRPIALKAMPLGKYKGRPFSDIPVEYLSWASRADFDQDLLFSIRSELKRRKKSPSFGQSANPFSEL